MGNRAENVVQNIGAIAETTSVFYNAISKQVPKDVALILTQHFMDITIAKRPISPAAAAAAAAMKMAEEKRRAASAASAASTEIQQQNPERPKAENDGEKTEQGRADTPPAEG